MEVLFTSTVSPSVSSDHITTPFCTLCVVVEHENKNKSIKCPDANGSPSKVCFFYLDI